MQRPRQGRQTRQDAGGQAGTGRDCHARGEGRGIELVVRQQTQRLPDGGFRARSFPGSRQLLADAAAREQRLGSEHRDDKRCQDAAGFRPERAQGPALRGQVGDTASRHRHDARLYGPGFARRRRRAGRHGGKIHACIAGLPQDGRDIFQLTRAGQFDGIGAPVPQAAIPHRRDGGRHDRITPFHGAAGHRGGIALPALASRHADHVVTVIQAAAGISAVLPAADLASADVGIQGLHAHARQLDGFMGGDPGHGIYIDQINQD